MATLRNETRICIGLPPKINSEGIVYSRMQDYPMPVLLFQILVIYVVTEIFHFLFRRFGQTKFTSQLLAGIMIGPTFLGKHSMIIFPMGSEQILSFLTTFNFIIYTFLLGVKMDPAMIQKTGKNPFFVGVLTMLVPLIVGIGIIDILTSNWQLDHFQTVELVSVTLIYSYTPFAAVCYLLSDLKILNSELGRIGLSSAIVTDILSLGFIIVANFAGTISVAKSFSLAIMNLIGIIVYLTVAVFLIRPAMFWIIKQTPEGRAVKNLYIYTIMLIVFGSSLYTDHVHLGLMFGPYTLGLIVPAGPPLGSSLEDKLKCFANGLFLPLFVTTCAVRADLSSIDLKSKALKGSMIIIASSIFGKFLVSLIPPLFSKLPKTDALALSFMLSFKSCVELSMATFLRDYKIISDSVFSLLVVDMLVTSIVVPIAVKFLYDPMRKYAGYKKRSVMHSDPHANLKILTCIYRSDNTAAMISLLKAVCPTQQNPISVYTLHLIKLIGRASPIFISHKLQQRTVSDFSYSEEMILLFNQFKRNYWESLTFEAFTTISRPQFMYEDICTLALDSLAALMILPFHRTWSKDGSIESEDDTIRALNCSVLERSPCSVGILIDRGDLGFCKTLMKESTSSYRVAVLFVGGKDDREALVLAKRMIRDSHITLTVMRFLAINKDNKSAKSWDNILDTEILKDLNSDTLYKNVVYKQHMVKDGPQTALIIRSMVNDYDLFVVGRRNNVDCQETSGLAEWSEFSELGVFGDMLASTDFKSKYSVLVLQQQQQSMS